MSVAAKKPGASLCAGVLAFPSTFQSHSVYLNPLLPDPALCIAKQKVELANGETCHSSASGPRMQRCHLNKRGPQSRTVAKVRVLAMRPRACVRWKLNARFRTHFTMVSMLFFGVFTSVLLLLYHFLTCIRVWTSTFTCSFYFPNLVHVVSITFLLLLWLFNFTVTLAFTFMLTLCFILLPMKASHVFTLFTLSLFRLLTSPLFYHVPFFTFCLPIHNFTFYHFTCFFVLYL